MSKSSHLFRKLLSVFASTTILLSMFANVSFATSPYTVNLSVNQPTYMSGTHVATNINPGNIVYFSYIASNGNAAWQWNWPSNIVDCSAFPEFDSPQLRCSIKANGTGPVSITMFPSGTATPVTSNEIYLSATGVVGSAYGNDALDGGGSVIGTSYGDDNPVCVSPYVLYNGSCTDPIPACSNPPAHVMPSTCIDKIVNGALIPRYSFQCMAGYVKTGTECISANSGAAATPTGTRVTTNTVDTQTVTPTVTSGGTGLKFSVDLTSSPAGYSVNDGVATEIKAKKGDKIMFTRTVDNKNAVNVAWDWNWESMLDCAPYPDFDSDRLRCTVLKDGLSKVSITMYPVTADGKKYTIHSNTIYVNTGAKNPTARPSNGTVSANSTNVSVPPAGYEKEVQVATATQDNPFSDTNIATVAGKAAAALYKYAIIGGFPDGEFKGGRSVNRAEAAKFLLLSRYETIPDNKNNGYFLDVLNDQWYTKYVITAAGLGVISGYSDGNFRPASTVNTAEFLKMLTLTFELNTNLSYSYSDVDGSAWYAQYAGIATKYNLFPDRGNKLQPSKLLTRDEVAIAIYKYILNK